jgi:hypothetical protein
MAQRRDDRKAARNLPAAPLDAQALRRRRLRNWALLGALAGFVVLVYLVALVKMGFFQ